MDPDSARFELLKLELQSLQTAIRGFDTLLFQIKGWCITVTVAIAGVALAQDQPALLVIALAAVTVFWFVDGHYKSIQRVFIRRDVDLNGEISGADDLLSVFRQSSGSFAKLFENSGSTAKAKFDYETRLMWVECKQPITYGLYALISMLLMIQMAVMIFAS